MLAVISTVNCATIEISEWGNSGFANSDNGLYPDQLNSYFRKLGAYVSMG